MKSEALRDFIHSYELRYRFSISLVTCTVSNHKESFSWQSDTKRPAASLMKLFILGTIAEEIALGNYNTQQRFTVNIFVGGSGLLKYINTPITLPLEELIYFMMAYSDNSATNRILELLTLDRVNEFINKIGAEDTKMVVPMMPTKSNNIKGYNHTTADDVLLFLKGTIAGFPISINQGCAPLCKKFFADSKLSFSNLTMFLYTHVRYLKKVMRHNPTFFGKYIYALLSVSRGERLTKDMAQKKVIAQKSATGKTVFHDSCIIRLRNGFLYIAALIQSEKDDFYKPSSNRYKAAQSLLRKIGKLALNETEE